MVPITKELATGQDLINLLYLLFGNSNLECVLLETLDACTVLDRNHELLSGQIHNLI